MKELKTQAFSVRFTRQALAELDELCKGTEHSRNDMIRASVSAAVKFYRKNGYLPSPLEIAPPASVAKRREDAPGQRKHRRERVGSPTTAQPPRQHVA